jgi:RHS repeat-associated protein
MIRHARSVVACVASIATFGALALNVQWPAASADSVPPPQTVTAVTSRPDLVSARIAAVAQGTRVEVSSLDTETSTTWANADGTLTTDISSGPVQAQDANGEWQSLDDTLHEQADGTVAPDVSLTDVVFGKDGSSTAATLGADAGAPALKWDGTLPAPSLDGDTATYPDVLPGTDLTAQSNPTGFELSLVVSDPAAAAALPDAIDLPLAGNDLTWKIDSSGVLTGRDASGSILVTSAGATAWDATRDAHTDEPLHSTPLELSLSGDPGSQVLHVATPRDLLEDPATVFPVTIDPSATWSSTAWTYIDSGFPNTSYFNSSGPAKVGTYNGGANKDRTLFKFKTSGLASKDIVSATFKIYENWSWSCTARAFDIWGVPNSFDSATSWSNQEPVGNKRGTITAAKGYSSSCPAGNVSTDFTSWATVVAANGNTYNSVELRSPNETDNTYWKKFDTTATVSVTYNSYPGTAGSLSVKPCSSQCSATVLTNSTTPSLTGKASDPDGGNLRYDFGVWNSAGSAEITSGSKSGVASGSTATWTVPSGKLTNGTTYKYHVRAWDGTDYGPLSAWLAFTVDTSAPAKPTLSSTTWTAGTWSSPTSGPITWTDASTDVATYAWQLDGGTWSAPTTATSKSLSNLTNNTEHTFSVKATDKAGNVSAVGSFTFGVGTGGLISPSDQDRTQRSVTLSAAGPQPYVAYQWRRGTTATWVNIPVAQVTNPSTGTSPAAWPVAIGAVWNWDVGSTAGNNDGLIQARACLYASTTDTSPTCQSNPVDVQLVTHTFGASYASDQVGPGQVSLLTGDYALSATDAEVTAYTGSLSVSRSLTTLTPAAANAGATGVFGPSWIASLDGPAGGSAGETATIASDKSYVVLIDADGGASVFVATSALTTSPISYTGLGDAADGSKLSYAYSLSTPSLTLTDTDGTQTNWTQQIGQWVPTAVIATGAAAQNTASYYYGSNGAPAGLASRIVAPAPTGVDCSSEVKAAATEGCRSLVFGYTALIVNGNTVQRLSSVSLNAWNPNRSGGAGMDTVQVAAYDYDANGRLAHAWDPRITPALKTAYGYDANNRLTTLAPPGQAAWSFGYDTAGCPSAASCGRLVTVSRPDPSGPTATSTVVYGVPLSGTGLPDLASATTATWGQDSDVTVQGGTPATAAVFGPDHVPAGTSPATVAASDWPYATIGYLDVNGRTVDIASYGAGAWQIDSARYNAQGNQVWSLTAGNRAQALNPTADTDPSVTALSNGRDRADALANISTYNADGTELMDTQGPTHPITLGNGSTIDARSHTVTSYDEAAPVGGPYRLPTTNATSALGLDGIDYDAQTSHTGYDGTTPNGTTGWALHQATTQTDPAGLVSTTHYDDAGRVVETDLPHNSSNASVRSTISTYYVTGSGSCGDAAQAGLLCETAPAAQPGTGASLLVTAFKYDMYGSAITKTESFGTGASQVVRTASASYDTAERLASSSMTVSPSSAGGTPLPSTTYGYETETGLPATSSVTSNGSTTTLATTYDSLGQIRTYVDANGTLSTYEYDLAGRLESFSDGKGTYSYSYDSSIEHRGLITGEDLMISGAPSQFAVTYDVAGNPASTTYPNGLLATRSYDNVGNLTSLRYSMAGTNWLEFDQSSDVHGRVAGQTSPASSQLFTYDGTGRLGEVQDTIADPNSGNTVCATRIYGFDNDSNRTSLASYPDAGTDTANGSCSTATTPTTLSATFDQADRLTSDSAGSYTYDTLGRTVTVPAGDAAGSATHAATSGTLTLSYYANDRVATESQGGQSITFVLDALQNRVASYTDTTTGATTVNHYGDNSDAPVWTSTASGWTRNLVGPDGGFVGSVDQNGTVTLDLSNAHGDTVATVTDTGTAVGPSSYEESTEYGLSRTGGYTPYGWLGSALRSSDNLGGLIAMGARLYNPSTGRFLSVDPIPGGSANAYDYCSQDPLNHDDISGATWYLIHTTRTFVDSGILWATGWKHVWHNHWWDQLNVRPGSYRVETDAWDRSGIEWKEYKVVRYYSELYFADWVNFCLIGHDCKVTISYKYWARNVVEQKERWENAASFYGYTWFWINYTYTWWRGSWSLA